MATKLKYGDSRWKDEFYVQAHQLARQGLSDVNVARTLGVSRALFERWVREKPALSYALESARVKDKGDQLNDYLYSRLDEELQDVWDRIEALEPKEVDCQEVTRDKRRMRIKIDGEFSQMSDRLQQKLFLFAWATCSWSKSEALRKCGISASKVERWMTDEKFSKLAEQMTEHKKDFMESALIELIRQREPSAVIFANKTMNRDRGYNDKVEVDVVGKVSHNVDELGLSLEQKLEILAKIREKQEPKKLLDNSQVIEVECEVK